MAALSYVAGENLLIELKLQGTRKLRASECSCGSCACPESGLDLGLTLLFVVWVRCGAVQQGPSVPRSLM